MTEILRYNAFAAAPGGGNPAGVVLDATDMNETNMQQIAKEVGYSETAFVTDINGSNLVVRYFAPGCEVPFCGHATIALTVAWADRHGPGLLRLRTQAGLVEVDTRRRENDSIEATLTSVPPKTTVIPADAQDALLAALGWTRDELDPALPVRAAYAGAWHPVLAAATRERLADLDYDMDTLAALMREHDWATITLVWREADDIFHVRNPFPPGGVREDPATGAAAAALGGYLRELELIDAPADLLIAQGYDMGRPSRIDVHLPADRASGIAVTGTATPM